MAFDQEQMGQLRDIMRETIREEVPAVVAPLIIESEKRVIAAITESVAEMFARWRLA
ncbi:hypothetical protein HYS28_02480 [Candidatus Uhrbacteria bacterium]|nr:hypothetical protein [Candidatus Uhrbacteria bacterium]